METKYVILFTRRTGECSDAAVEPVLYGSAAEVRAELGRKLRRALDSEKAAAAKLDPEWADALTEENLKDFGWSWDGETYLSFESKTAVPGQDSEPVLTWKAVEVSEIPAANRGSAV